MMWAGVILFFAFAYSAALAWPMWITLTLAVIDIAILLWITEVEEMGDLPPGVTDRDVDRSQGYDPIELNREQREIDADRDMDREKEAEAWRRERKRLRDYASR